MRLKASCRWLLAMILSAAPSGLALAQPEKATTRTNSGAPGPGAMLLERLRPIMDEMQVSDEQREQIEKIVADAREKMEAARQELRDLAPAERMEHFQSYLRDLRDDVSEVLTPEQREIFLQRADQLRQRLGQGGQIVERLKENLGKLKLSDQQKQKVDALMADAQKQFDELREALRSGDEDARRKLGEMLQESRQQLDEILSNDQREKLRELMMQPTTRPAKAPDQSRGEMRPEPAMSTMDQDSAMDERPSGKREPQRAAAKEASSEPALAIGSVAPDFELKKLDGTPVRLSSYDGRVVVLVGGSYSCPVFRDNADELEAMKKQVGQRANVILVYTKEAHAAGQWEVARNKKDEIQIQQHQTMDQRKAAAEKAREALKLSVPVVLDSMENTVADQFGIFPNGAVVIGRDGKVVAVQRWFNADTLSRKIDEALKTPATQPA